MLTKMGGQTKTRAIFWMEGFKKLTYLISQQLGINTATIHTIPRKALMMIPWDV
jgi:hypothetical protein